jgi:hypothetical protein
MHDHIVQSKPHSSRIVRPNSKSNEKSSDQIKQRNASKEAMNKIREHLCINKLSSQIDKNKRFALNSRLKQHKNNFTDE